MNFVQENKSGLENFAELSQKVGARADYVQGGGGNTSVKLAGGLMAIKASGYCLSDITEANAYAVLDYVSIAEFYNSHVPADFDDVEKHGSNAAKAAIRQIEGLPALRPSVEAGFHSLLKKYVAHSHSVYANLACCAVNAPEIIAAALEGSGYVYIHVPYTNPGAGLTFAIKDLIAQTKAATGKAPDVVFLQNHGVVATSDDADECVRIHDDVNERLAAHFGLTAADFPKIAVKKEASGLLVSDTPYLAERLKTGKYDAKFFSEHTLYPDYIVFLNGTLFFEGEPQPGACVADTAAGTVTYNMDEKAALVVEQTLTSAIFICENILRRGYKISTMGEEGQAFIANWESEKYRKSLAGK